MGNGFILKYVEEKSCITTKIKSSIINLLFVTWLKDHVCLENLWKYLYVEIIHGKNKENSSIIISHLLKDNKNTLKINIFTFFNLL